MAHHHLVKIRDNVLCRDKIYGAFSVTIDFIKSSSPSSEAHPFVVEMLSLNFSHSAGFFLEGGGGECIQILRLVETENNFTGMQYVRNCVPIQKILKVI